jgi:CRP/FNR family cyclic AMP-dependent transcriptional regulator
VLEGGSTRIAGNVALLPVDCRVISGEQFLAYLEAHPPTSLPLARVIVGRLRAADRRRQASASMAVSRSLASFLVELVDRYGVEQSDGVDLSIPLTQEELASLMSCSRDSAVRGLSTLRARRLIATARRRIIVTNLDGLRSYASGVLLS